MIRVPLVNPLLLLLAAQARHQVPQAPGDPWQGLGLVCPQPDDTERSCATWTDTWAPGTRMSLAEAKRHLFFTAPASLPQPQPDQVALGAAHPESSSPEVALIPWQVQGRRYHPQAVEAMVQAKASHRQIWLDVPFEHGLAAAQDDLVHDGLRLGCAWFLRPPASASDQPAYLHALRQWGQHVLSRRDFDQWVWPWADLVLRGLVAYALTGTGPKRQGAPPGWPAHASALHWPALSREVMEVVDAQIGSEAVARDLFMGLMLEFPAPSESSSA